MATGADEREQDDRQLLQERVETEVEGRRVGQRDDEPVLGDDLHPRADARGAGANPLHAEVAVGEGHQGAAYRACGNGSRRFGCLGGRGGG